MNITVDINLQKQKPPALYPDISDKEIYLIGKVTASWALLESLVIKLTVDLAETSSHDLPLDFLKNNTLEKTLKEFKTLINKIEKPEKLKITLGNILKRVNNLKTHRHMLTHGIFAWDLKSPEKLKQKRQKTSSPPNTLMPIRLKNSPEVLVS